MSALASGLSGHLSQGGQSPDNGEAALDLLPGGQPGQPGQGFQTTWKNENRRVICSLGCNLRGQVDPHSEALFETVPVQLDALGSSDDEEEGREVIEQVCAGGTFSLALGSQGRVYAWGMSFLGDGTEERKFTRLDQFYTIGRNPVAKCKIVSISAGQSHAAAVSNEGEVFTWGLGLSGRLGHKGEHSTPFPRRVNYLWKAMNGNHFSGDNFKNGLVLQVACGDAHTTCLTSNGIVYAWGLNINYQCSRMQGSGSKVLEPRRVKIEGLPEEDFVSAVYCGQQHSMVLTDRGCVFSWGLATFGRLGHSTTAYNTKSVGYPRKIELFSAESAYESVFKLSLGSYHGIALSCSGHVFVWGRNDKGQLGLGKTVGFVRSPALLGSIPEHVIVSDVQAGECHSMAVASSRVPSSDNNGTRVQEHIFLWGIGFGGGGTSPSVAFDDEDVWYTPTEVQMPVHGWCPSASLGGAHMLALIEENDRITTY